MTNLKHKSLQCKIQFISTSVRPETEIIEWFEDLLALHLNQDSYYIKWKNDESCD